MLQISEGQFRRDSSRSLLRQAKQSMSEIKEHILKEQSAP